MHNKNSLGDEQLIFSPKFYSMVMDSLKLFPTYVEKLEIIDTDIKNLINLNELPLITKEHYSTTVNVPDSGPSQAHLSALINLVSNREATTKASTLTHENGSSLHKQSERSISKIPGSSKTLHSKMLTIPKAKNNELTTMDFITTAIHNKFEVGDQRDPQSNYNRLRKNIISKLKLRKQRLMTEDISMSLSKDSQMGVEVVQKSDVCFMLHGLEGSSYDMRNLRSALQMYCPKVRFYLSDSNENKTSESIELMGQRFAKEVKDYIDDHFIGKEIRISMIGYSLGGLIARAALPHLRELSCSLYTFITLSTPHLGAISDRFLVNTGMKILGKLKNSQSLRQMSLDDEEEYLLHLSQYNGLIWFKNIVLVASYDDGYTPYESAKILRSYKPKSRADCNKMATNIYEKMNAENIVKICMHIPRVSKGFDFLIGRQAHVEILENPFLMHLVVSQLKSFL